MAILIRIFLLYPRSALAVTQSDEFVEIGKVNQKEQDKMMLALWIALRQACDLLDGLTNPPEGPSTIPIDRKNLVFAVSWLCFIT